MKLYLASRYSTKDQISGYAAELCAAGVEVTSSWLDEPHSPNTQMSEVHEDQLREYAVTDLRDIDRADALVFFSVDPTMPTVRGGRHVEFGYALGIRKPIIVVGPQENIFHCLLGIQRFDTWDEAKQYLIKVEIVS